MKISEWLLGHYKKRFGEFTVLQHDSGSTWNDGGSWSTTIIKCGGEILKVHMPSDYNCDNLEVTKMKTVMKETYQPV